MSALGGVYNLDGAPVDPEILKALSRGLDSHGSDGGSEHISGSVGMVYRAFHTNRESRLEKQPFLSPWGHVLCWDGRLDNRDELIAQLGEDIQGDRTDAAIVMGAYLRWDTEFLRKIIGDFALSLWNPAVSGLKLARDPFGTRPLYYVKQRSRVVWSSDLASLLEAAIEAGIDEEYVAGYLAGSIEPWRSPYNGVYAVEPAVVVTICNSQLHKERFWFPSRRKEVTYSSAREYEEQFRQLFREAVRCRLRSDGPVWSELSGGLDSSSIVCVADDILRTNEADAPKLECVTYVYDSSPTSDERRFAEAVEHKRERAGFHVPHDEWLLRLDSLDHRSIIRPNPYFCAVERYLWMSTVMAKQGARVLLSGIFGDNLLWSVADTSPELADLLVKGRLMELHRQALAWCNARRLAYPAVIWRGALLPVLPRRIAKWAQPSPVLLGLVQKRFVSQRSLRERSLRREASEEAGSPSNRLELDNLAAGVAVVSRCFHRDLMPVDYSFPYLHRPLVEFLLGVPLRQKLLPGETRSLQRRSLGHLLPSEVTSRRDKRGPDEALCRAIDREWRVLDELFSDPLVCSYGFVVRDALREAVVKSRHGIQQFAAAVTKVLCLELWLRALANGRLGERLHLPGNTTHSTYPLSAARRSGSTTSTYERRRTK